MTTGKSFARLIASLVFVGILPAPSGAAPKARKPVTYTSPFQYCAAVGTVDAPGRTYRGPSSPIEISRVVGEPSEWRCVSGRVLACNEGASGRACMKMAVSRVPHAGIRRACRENPNADVSMAALGNDPSEWRCRGGVPQLVSTPALDPRGFFPNAWTVIGAPSNLVSVYDGGTGAADFVHAMYEQLAHHTSGYPAWWGQLSARARQLKHRLDAHDALTGNLTIDHDWLCQCQDPEGLRVEQVAFGESAPTHADAMVTIRNGGRDTTVRLHLVKEGSWKIDDIIDGRGNRYTAVMERSLGGRR